MSVSPVSCPSVTVVVAAYNVGPYIDECLESLVAQTLPDLDILIIEDGSTDDTLTKVRRFAGRFPGRIRVIAQENRGIGHVRNRGIAEARGQYLGYVDGDDWVEPEMYETLYRGAEEHRADQTICDGVLVEHTTRRRDPFYDRPLWDQLQPGLGRLFDPAALPDFFLLNSSVCKRLYRIEFLRQAQYRFVERLLFEDAPAHYELFCRTNRVLLIDRPFYNYRHGHPRRRTGRSDRALVQAVEVVFRMVRSLRSFGAGPDLWANLIREQDWLFRWLGRQIDAPHAREFACAACRLAPHFPASGVNRFRVKFNADQAGQTGVSLQIEGNAEAYMAYVRDPGAGSGQESPGLGRHRGNAAAPATAGEATADCRVPILMYHSIADNGPPELAARRLPRAMFREQMQLLVARGYYSITLAEWGRAIAERRPLPGHPVILTFDDGYRDFFTNAWPVLAECGLRATIFVVTASVGAVNDWDGEPGRSLALMDWDELRRLQSMGNTIGSHCTAHRNLTRLTSEMLEQDCREARAQLCAELGRDVTAVAFPFGDTNRRVRAVLGENGYRVAVGISAGLSSVADDPMDLPRIEIFGDDDVEAFALKIDLAGYETGRSGPLPQPAGGNTGHVQSPTVRGARLAPTAAAAAVAVPTVAPDKLSFVLPVALADTGRPADELARLNLLLASCCKYLDKASVADFLIVTRLDDLAAVKAAVSAFPIPLLTIVDEREFCPELAQDPDTTSHWPVANRGWYRQQLVKLAAFAHVRTNFYMTLDADIIFVKPFAASDLLRRGRSLVNTQTAKDYESLWLPAAARHEMDCRRDRDRDAARVLRMDRRSGRLYGETPVVLCTEIVRQLTRHLAAVGGKDWQKYLLEQRPWTEYSLYFTFAEATGLFERHHVAGGFDAVLGMRDSLWSPPQSYTDGRDLSSWTVAPHSSDTVAVVVQSYLGYAAEAVGARAAALSIL